MRKKKITDEEIAEGIIQEVEFTMKRVEESHTNAVATKGPLKSDSYSQMVDNGLWDARRIVSEYLLIKKKESRYSVGIRQYIVTIFEVASTNFWAKKAAEQREREVASKGNRKKKP